MGVKLGMLVSQERMVENMLYGRYRVQGPELVPPGGQAFPELSKVV
jgi:hypothetical protein